MKFVYALVLAWLISVLACAGCAYPAPLSLDASGGEVTQRADTSSEVFLAQVEVIGAMSDRYPSVEYDLQFYPCRSENSFYFPETGYYRGIGHFTAGDILLCTEFAAYPRAAVYVAAHEFAHAVLHQKLRVLDEESADELAAIEMLRLGMGAELLEGALYWQRDADDEVGSSGHPATRFRAWNLACLAAGADGHPGACVALYHGTRIRWEERLAKWRADGPK